MTDVADGPPSRRWIAWAIAGVTIHVVLVAAYWPRRPPTLEETRPTAHVEEQIEAGPPPGRIYARFGRMESHGCTTFVTPTVRLTPGGSDADRVRGWGACCVGFPDPTPLAEMSALVAMVPSARTQASPTLYAARVSSVSDYETLPWIEFRCEADDMPVDARIETSWCGRWSWTSSVLELRADGTATLGSALGAVRRWGVVDGVIYLRRFDAPPDRFGTVVGVRDGDDTIRFAAAGEARRVR
jgi:hypothetical protein